MKKPRPDLIYLGVTIIIVIFVAGLTWGNYQYSLDNPGNNDFVSRWLGTRLFLNEGLSPYSEETTLRIQEFFYGRAALETEDQHLFVYPHFSMLFFIPFALIENFALARAFWMTLLEVAVLGISFLSIAIMRWRPEKIMLTGFLMFSLFWYHSLSPVINGNPAILVALFISVAFYFISKGRFSSAGVFLAFTTIKPQMVVLLIPFVLLWALINRKTKLFSSFFVSMFFLVGASFLIDSNWFIANIRQLLSYPSFTPTSTTIEIFSDWWPQFGNPFGLGLSVFLGIILLTEWILALKKDENWFIWTACLTLVITNLIGLRTNTSNYIALLPALVLVFAVLQDRWSKNSRVQELIILLLFSFGLWWLNDATIIQNGQPIQHPVMYFPVPIFLFFALYWVRHWKLLSHRMQIDELRYLKKLNY